MIEPTGSDTDREWLLTNGLGGFAMGTVSGIPTRRYHGFLVTSMSPPVDRLLALHAVIDACHWPDGTEESLASFSFQHIDQSHPDGWTRLVDCDVSASRVVWKWNLRDGVTIERSLHLHRGAHGCTVQWKAMGLSSNLMLRVQPLVLLRDMHALQQTMCDVDVRYEDQDLHVRRQEHKMSLHASRGSWHGSPQWWHEFHYAMEAARGWPDHESSLAIATLEIPLSPDHSDALLSVTLDADCLPAPSMDQPARTPLEMAASTFVVTRDLGTENAPGCSIIAGYPWFADWGRDAMISLPGLLLSTGQLDIASQVLLTFASHMQNGLIPNRFDDQDGQIAHYNTADASLWFLHAVSSYVRAAGGRDRAPHANRLLLACLDVIQSHHDGRSPGIRIDEDGLVEAGLEGEALTWMDARIDGVAVTPRIGKPIELSSLWHSGLRLMADLMPESDAMLTSLADRAAASFSQFWNAEHECCFDLLIRDTSVAGGWLADPAIRPNQIFAISCPYSPLQSAQQHSVLTVIERELLTPFGLRTLSRNHPDYCGQFTGDMTARDTAYHNGTVWPWLIGPYADAVRHLVTDKSEAHMRISQAAQRLLDSLTEGCVGQIAEVYDGDAPHLPHGCPAQAWSVAELCRIMSEEGVCSHAAKM